jgi:hypothetical protein
MDWAEREKQLMAEESDFYRRESERLEREKLALQNQSVSAPLLQLDPDISVQEAVTPSTSTPDTGLPFVEVPNKEKPDHFPAFMSRSALFRASQATETNFDEITEIPSQDSTIRVLGPRLSMRDKAVWEIAIQLAKEESVDMSQAFQVSLRDFVRRLGEKDTGGAGLASVWGCLQRLALARITFDIKGQCSGLGSILSTAVKSGGHCYLRLNPDFVCPALTTGLQFRLNSQRRNSLAMPLAQWLHDFYSTHTKSRDIDLAYLKNLCGYVGENKNFVVKLRKAMGELATSAPTLIAKFEIIKRGRDSEKWILRVVKGTELPQFDQPQHVKARTPTRKLLAL